MSDKESLTAIARRICPNWMHPTGDAHYRDVKRELERATEELRRERDKLKEEAFHGEQSAQFLKDTITQLRAENEELKRDKERLDWLVSHGAFISHSRDGEVCNVWFSHDPDDDGGGAVPVEGYPQKCYYYPRAAIDAARKQGDGSERVGGMTNLTPLKAKHE